MFQENQIIGRHYKLLQKLGAGGMGAVYKALDVNLGREVAIKFLLKEIAEEKEIVDRFLNEGRIIATINHPAVISVYASDVEEATGMPFLVMEFVDGHSLDHYKKELRNDLDTLIDHFINMLSGINACHKKGIIHRDLKPENLLINSNGQIKICDFGIARSAGRHTRTGMAIGTPHYMSPEQCMGKQDLITGQTDVYAAGVVLFEMLTGKLPFNLQNKADDPALAIALMHISQKPDYASFASIPEGVSFKELISQMLEKKPDDRPEIPDIINKLKGIQKRLSLSGPSASSTESKPTTSQPSDIIGEIYKVQCEIGSGGMGKVVKALDTSLNRIVAIKTLHKSSIVDDSLVNRFIKEGQVLATVRHKNVMGIYASAKDRITEVPFLVMEYIEGRPLSELRDVIKKDCTRSIPIMLQLAEGVEAFHEHGIIHRDLKPSNIIITSDGIVKIIDFGIAKTQGNLTKTGMTMGTPEYMSPEQCTGNKNISYKSDIYSLGIIFWELIFGAVPFKPDSDQNSELSVALKHIEATLPAQVIIPDLTLIPIIGLTKRMLDKSPDARPEVRTIIGTLEDYLAEHAPELLSKPSTSRRSMAKSGINSLSQLVSDAQISSSYSKKKILIPIIVAISVGLALLLWKSGLIGGKNLNEIKNEINELIISGEYSQAQIKISEFAMTSDGRELAPKLKEALVQQILSDSTKEEKAGNYEQAINLIALAISIDPGNPRGALGLTRLQQEKTKFERQKNRIDTISKNAAILLEQIEPASGTKLLNELIKELSEIGQNELVSDIKSAWRSKFINKGEEILLTNPQMSQAYFNDYLKYFPGDDEVITINGQATKQIALLEEKLAQETMLNSIIPALKSAIENYIPGTKPTLITNRIQKVLELGDEDTARELKELLVKKMIFEADNLMLVNPEKSIEIFEQVKSFYPDFIGLDNKLSLAQESLKSVIEAEELKTKRDSLYSQISKETEKIVPPQDVSTILNLISQLSEYAASSSIVEELRENLYKKYFDAASKQLDNSNLEEAKKILEICMKISPSASGLSEISEKIETRIIEMAKEKERLANLEKERLAREKKAEEEALKLAEKRRAEAEKKAAEELKKQAELKKIEEEKKAVENARLEEIKKQQLEKDKAESERIAKIEAARKAAIEAEKKAAIEAAKKAEAQKIAEEKARAEAELRNNLYVGSSEKYKNIGDAVSAATDGNIITVRAGTYIENITVAKNISITGENTRTCIITTNSKSPTIVASGNSMISNLTIKNTSDSPTSTVELNGNASLSNCIINNSTPAPSPDFSAGIEITGGQPTLKNCNVSETKGMGLTIKRGSPLITGCNINNCGIYGIWYNGPAGGTVQGNQIKQCQKSGAGIKAGGNPIFINNVISENGENGFLIYSEGLGRYEGNEISNNKMYGFDIWDASPQSIHGNKIEKNRKGYILVRGKQASPRIGSNNFDNNRTDNIKNQGGKIIPY